MKWMETNSRHPYYSIWKGARQLVFSWNNDDLQEGQQTLLENLQAFEQSGVSDVFTLKLHSSLDKNDEITNNSPVYASLNFRACNPYQVAAVGGARGTEIIFPNNQGMQAMLEEIRAIRAEQQLLQQELQQVRDADKDEDEGLGGFEGALIGLLKSPEVQRTVAAYIPGLMAKIMPGVTPAAPGSLGNVAAPGEEEKIDQALDILEKYDPQLGEDLMILARIAQQDGAKFTMILNMLRANG